MNNQLINLQGRQWVIDERLINQVSDEIYVKKAMVKTNQGWACQRCGSLSNSTLPQSVYYCRECIGLGRICQTDFLCSINEKNQQISPRLSNQLTWTGTLTTKQTIISQALQQSLKNSRDHLVHAVTGAGKTEMLFEVVNLALSLGQRVCLATPRIDVVNELFPRFQQAFLKLKIGKYHGQEFHEPKFDLLTICTTHQLMKFYRAFDLVIIDEVDAFPFRNSDMLAFGLRNAIKSSGSCFYLTATPGESDLRKVQQDKLDYSLLKRRFHGYNLPVPKCQLILGPSLKKKKRLHRLIDFQFSRLLKSNKPIMVFIPRIDQLSIYLAIFEKRYPKIKFASVYSADENRLQKVEEFRNGKIDVLLTTTILERGVTIKNVQVVIIDADDGIYNTASLVQIAGRVGRAADDPNGRIYFFYQQYTKEIKAAIKQIKRMNQND